MHALPRTLQNFSPIAGQIKLDYDDFHVEEIPLYPAAGAGTHTYFLVQKAGLTTPQAANDIARALGVRRRDVGFAGMKDSRAVTRQWFSLEHIDPAAIQRINLPRITILEVTQHRNKLRLGHLKGNRFLIRVRNTDTTRLPDLQSALATLTNHGVPNYFGPQRFGSRGDTWQTGQALLRNDLDTALDLILGQPGEFDHGAIRRARELYHTGHYAQARSLWPGMFRDERRALATLERTSGNKRRALAAIDKGTRRLYVSAYQSHLFNQVVAARLTTGLQTLWPGDLAYLHANGAVFTVEDAQAEQPRADAFEISPTGPLFGYRMTEPAGQAAEIEARLLTEANLTRASFHQGPHRVKGSRRPLRFRPDNAEIRLGADQRGAYLELSFVLPRGCYATCLLRELFTEQGPQSLAADDPGTEDHTD
jgi:tRNA pseudouridine13 synthase